MRTQRTMLLAATLALVASPAAAQHAGPLPALNDTTAAASTGKCAHPATDPATHPVADPAASKAGAQGLNAFEGKKFEGPFDGVKISLGGAFTLGFQALDHSNTAAAKIDPATKANLNQLGEIRPGINLPAANLNLNVQLAPGINMVLESYMSSRHHNEFWVKGGYATIDRSPIDLPLLNALFRYTTVRAGMYEPFYGDAIYRRSDNGNTLRNPFAENLVLDAFTTEPGMDATVRAGNAFVMLGATTGENKGNVKKTYATVNNTRTEVSATPAVLAKVGYDRQVSELLRVRLSGSVYNATSSPRTTLYGGDRAGSNYWNVVDNAAAASFTNGRLTVNFANELTAWQINPFVQLGGLELFGVVERASGKAASEAERRELSQYAGDVVYRLAGNRLYVAGRYNTVQGDPTAADRGVTVERKVVSGGWFISPNMLTKVEYVTQSFEGFAAMDIRNGARFDGFVVQGSIAF